MTRFNSPLFLQIPACAHVDAAPVRAHLAHLSANGIGYKRAAELAGVSVEVTRAIVIGRRGQLALRVATDRAAKILAVQPCAETAAYVPALGAHRRIQALMLNGWSQAKLAARLNVSVTHFRRLMDQERIRATTHWALAALFDQLWDKTPPMVTTADKVAAARSRATALENGWRPALAWDDIDTDARPAPTPRESYAVDELAVELAVEGRDIHLTPLERESAVRRLHARYLSDGEIAARLRVPVRTVLRIRKRLGLPAVVNAARELIYA